MRNKIFILVCLCLALIGCSGSDDDKIEEQNGIPSKLQPTPEWNNLILGDWEFVEQCETETFGPGYSCRTPSIHHFTFRPDSNILTNAFGEECSEGSYSIDQDILSVDLPCNSYDVEIHFLDENQLIFIANGDDTALYRIYKKING